MVGMSEEPFLTEAGMAWVAEQVRALVKPGLHVGMLLKDLLPGAKADYDRALMPVVTIPVEAVNYANLPYYRRTKVYEPIRIRIPDEYLEEGAIR